MKPGTKTLLFGTHQIFLHPIFVFCAWLIRYHSLPRLSELIAIIVHDWGLWGMPNLDGKEGEQHPARVGDWFFKQADKFGYRIANVMQDVAIIVLGHSRFFAMQRQCGLSKLFQADKLAAGLYPAWLYIFLGTLSGEINEYMARAENGKYQNSGQFGKVDKLTWFLDLKSRLTIMGLDRDVEKYMQNKNHWEQK